MIDKPRYDDGFQKHIIELVLADASLHEASIDYFNHTFFDKRFQALVEFINRYKDEYKQMPSMLMIRDLFPTTTIQEIEYVDNGAKEWFYDNVRKFAKQETYRNFILDSADDLGKEDYVSINERFGKLVAKIDNDDAKITNYVNDLDSRMECLITTMGELTWGSDVLDSIVGKNNRGHYSVIGGDTGKGKTTMALSIALDMARAGLKVHIASLEMTKDELGLKLDSMVSGIHAKELTSNKAKIALGLGAIKGRITISEHKSYSTTGQIADGLKKAIKENGEYDYLIIDHISIVKCSKKLFREDDIHGNYKHSMAEILDLTQRHKIHTILLSQLVKGWNKDKETAGVSIADLAGGRDLSNSASNILVLNGTDTLYKVSKTRVACLKNRHGYMNEGGSAMGKNIMFGINKRTYKLDDCDQTDEDVKQRDGQNLKEELNKRDMRYDNPF